MISGESTGIKRITATGSRRPLFFQWFIGIARCNQRLKAFGIGCGRAFGTQIGTEAIGNAQRGRNIIANVGFVGVNEECATVPIGAMDRTHCPAHRQNSNQQHKRYRIGNAAYRTSKEREPSHKITIG